MKPTQYLILTYFIITELWLFHEDLQVTSPTFFLPPLTSLVYKEARVGTRPPCMLFIISLIALHSLKQRCECRHLVWSSFQTPTLSYSFSFLYFYPTSTFPYNSRQNFTQDFPNLTVHWNQLMDCVKINIPLLYFLKFWFLRSGAEPSRSTTRLSKYSLYFDIRQIWVWLTFTSYVALGDFLACSFPHLLKKRWHCIHTKVFLY